MNSVQNWIRHSAGGKRFRIFLRKTASLTKLTDRKEKPQQLPFGQSWLVRKIEPEAVGAMAS